ncbi:MAG TPA: carboxymuconolactone decarboxylase family protein [Candidatus Binatia bacterium]|nr:carboxymuconolactone decarboxylase family protein [Candidatus Binatia bacterium]
MTSEQAALVRVSAAVAAGAPADVAAQARASIEAGVDASALYESVLQSYLFVGFPRAIEALFAVAPILVGGVPDRAAPTDPDRWRRDGDSLCRRVYGRNYDKLVETMRGLSPDLADWMILEGYGKTLSRPGLGAVERELCVVAILTATRMWRQLRSHAIGAVNVGAARADVKEAIMLSEPWSGATAVREGLAVAGLA